MNIRLFALLMATGLLICGCAPEQPAASYAPEEAKRLMVYTSHKSEVFEPILREFETRTGIWVETVTGGTSELLEQLSQEANSPKCDVMFGGGVESLAAYQQYFEPYICADVSFLADTGRSPEHLWTPFSSLPVVLIYNSRLVEQGQLTGWSGLLDPRWRGKIALADPSISGSSYTAVTTLVNCLPSEPQQTLTKLVDTLEGNILSDSGAIVQTVQSGVCYIGVTLEETALKGKAKGANIELVYPIEGTSAVPDGTALVAGAPHPENAKLFLDFVLGRDVQQLLGSMSRRSVRTDLPESDKLPSAKQLKLIEYDVLRAGEEKAEFLRLWRQLMEEAE